MMLPHNSIDNSDGGGVYISLSEAEMDQYHSFENGEENKTCQEHEKSEEGHKIIQQAIQNSLK